MSTESVDLLVSIGTFLVIGASAIAALVHLRHVSASNQLEALLSIEREFHGGDMQQSFRFVQEQLTPKLADSEFRAELERIGFIDVRKHPEVTVLNWFSKMGTVIKHSLVEEATFMEMFGRLAVQYWEILAPVIALIRRRRGDAQYQNFEYLAIRARKWLSDHPHGTFPPGTPRIPIIDEWRDEDDREAAADRKTPR
jgi:hypothetical protein